jgi:uncharacterized protein DUF3710
MAVFRRRRTRDESSDEDLDGLDEGVGADFDDSAEVAGDLSAGDDVAAAAEPPSTTGPFDVADEPDDGVARVDLGSLKVPVPDGVELRLEVDQETQSVMGAVVVLGASALQVGAFAAPRSSGIWSEVADEIAAGLREAGGGAEPAEGTFGRELRARIPMENPTGGRTVQPGRFIGVDGPRWFLRGLLQGPAATDPVQARPLEDIFRGVVVVRGGEAMAPRDGLPLHMPRDITETPQPATQAEDADDDRYGLDPFERGPEITEIR